MSFDTFTGISALKLSYYYYYEIFGTYNNITNNNDCYYGYLYAMYFCEQY